MERFLSQRCSAGLLVHEEIDGGRVGLLLQIEWLQVRIVHLMMVCLCRCETFIAFVELRWHWGGVDGAIGALGSQRMLDRVQVERLPRGASSELDRIKGHERSHDFNVEDLLSEKLDLLTGADQVVLIES